MGTSGIVHFHDGDLEAECICFVYKQSDGYPDGLGDQIRDVLGQKNLVNGIRFGLENQVNGMGCASAQFIAAVKDKVGSIYMVPGPKSWADYDYHIYYNGSLPEPGEEPIHLRMKVMSQDDEMWRGDLSDFDGSSLYEE